MSNNSLSDSDLALESAKVSKMQANAAFNEGLKAYRAGNLRTAKKYAALLDVLGKPGYMNTTGSPWSRNAIYPNKYNILTHQQQKIMRINPETRRINYSFRPSEYNLNMKRFKANPKTLNNAIKLRENLFTNDDLAQLYGTPALLPSLPPSPPPNSGYSSNSSTGFVPPQPETLTSYRPIGSPPRFNGGKRTRKNLKKRSHRRNNRKNGRTSRRN